MFDILSGVKDQTYLERDPPHYAHFTEIGDQDVITTFFFCALMFAQQCECNFISQLFVVGCPLKMWVSFLWAADKFCMFDGEM